MKLPQCRLGHLVQLLLLALAAPTLAGCATPRSREPVVPDPIPPLQVGENIQVEMAGTPQAMAPLNLTISDEGAITLPLIAKPITVVGLRPRELEAIIQSSYAPTIYKDLTVTVTIGLRFYYVSGEVNQPENGKHLYTGKVTVLGAIKAAGGFNDVTNV